MAGRSAAGTGTPLFPAAEQTPAPGPCGSGSRGQPDLASWQLSVSGNMLIAVWPEHCTPGAKGNQSGAPACPQGRGLRCGQGGERQEMRSVSILAPASLREKATENISPQTSKPHAANHLLGFLALTWNLLGACGRDWDNYQRQHVGLSPRFLGFHPSAPIRLTLRLPRDCWEPRGKEQKRA